MEPGALVPRRAIPTTLVLDFYDSYTRNLLSLFSQLSDLPPRTLEGGKEAVWEGIGWEDRVVIVNVDHLTWESFTIEYLPYISCVILGPGPGSPHKVADFSWPKRLIEEYGHVLPIFGLCLGLQGLAITYGGHVVKAAAPRHGQVSRIRHSGTGLFDGIPQMYESVQYNSLVAEAETLPEVLEAIGWTNNSGRDEIMALRHREKPLWGVQFHPESIASTYGAELISNFLSMAQGHRTRHTPSFNTALPLPLYLRSLTTSYKRGLPNLIPDIPSLSPVADIQSWKWEQRSVLVGEIGAMPQDVFERFTKGSNSLGEIWLDSARPTVSQQFSHLFTPTFTWSFSRPSNTLIARYSSGAPTSSSTLSPPCTFFSVLGTAQGMLKRFTKVMDPTLSSVPIGFVGYFGYEMKDVTLAYAAKSAEEGVGAEFAFASTLLSFDHSSGQWRATGLVRVAGDGGGETEDGTEFGVDESEWKAWLSTVHSFFSTSSTTDHPPTSYQSLRLSLDMLIPDLPKEDYKRAIENARQSIIAGDAYELCLTTQFRTTISPSIAADPYGIYRDLRRTNPAPYSAYFHLPLSDISILSSSPERFLQISKEGRAEMKPIKGTVRRSADPIEDEARRVSLEKDEKERAENLMIVDLCRHDLEGFCVVETVKVPKLMVVESYQTVHQLVTSIVGQLTPVVNPFEAVARAFPPGSMTGAPKLRSVRLLEELEQDKSRGVYAGVFGYVAVDGTTDFSVVIRTITIKGTNLTLGAGGAITHLSDVDKEWEEVLIKMEAVLGTA